MVMTHGDDGKWNTCSRERRHLAGGLAPCPMSARCGRFRHVVKHAGETPAVPGPPASCRRPGPLPHLVLLERAAVMQPHDQRGINLVEKSREAIVHEHRRKLHLRKVPSGTAENSPAMNRWAIFFRPVGLRMSSPTRARSLLWLLNSMAESSCLSRTRC